MMSWVKLDLSALVARASTWLGMVFLSLTAISLIAAPITQHMWTWDRFLHGGQDFETSALVILTSLNLVLVLAQCCKASVRQSFAALRVLSSSTDNSGAEGSALERVLFASRDRRIKGPDLSARNLQLQI